MSDDGIACLALTKRFRSVAAVTQLTFEVEPGEVVGFVGPNGAGKTTSIRMLIGVFRPTAGRCRVLGGSLASDVRLRRRVGYLPGDLRVEPTFTGQALFSWFGRPRGGENRARVDELVARLQLDPSRPFRTLSKGNRQKVGIVAAFMNDPDVLVLDEPTTGLDPLMQREFLTLVTAAAGRGAEVLFSSHVLPEVARIADRVAIIRNGRLVTVSSVEELLDRARHRLELRFADAVPGAVFSGVAGVVDARADGRTVVVTIDGAVAPALQVALDAGDLLRVSAVGDGLEDELLGTYAAAAEWRPADELDPAARPTASTGGVAVVERGRRRPRRPPRRGLSDRTRQQSA